MIKKAKYPKVGSDKFGGLNKGAQKYGSLGANNRTSNVVNIDRNGVIVTP